jgi:hypothetical protein
VLAFTACRAIVEHHDLIGWLLARPRRWFSTPGWLNMLLRRGARPDAGPRRAVFAHRQVVGRLAARSAWSLDPAVIADGQASRLVSIAGGACVVCTVI